MPIQGLSGIEQIMKSCALYIWRQHREKEIRPRRGGSSPHSESSLPLESARNKAMHRKVNLERQEPECPMDLRLFSLLQEHSQPPLAKKVNRNYSIQNVTENIFLLSTRSRYLKCSCFLLPPPPVFTNSLFPLLFSSQNHLH